MLDFVLVQVTRPENGKDVNLKLVVTSLTSAVLQLSINTSVQAMRHNGTPAANILSEVTEETLEPWKGASPAQTGPSEPTWSCTWNQRWFHLSSSVSRRTVHLRPRPLPDLLSTHVGL